MWKVTNRCICVQMATHIFNLKLELVLGAAGGTLEVLSVITVSIALSSVTLNARCSRKWAVPFVLSVSARLPASIQTPTVEV